MILSLRRLQARLANRFYPGYGKCGYCTRNWCICTPHATDYTPEHGLFPLCQDCWQELSIEERLPYYRHLWQEWQCWDRYTSSKEGQAEWRLIEEAVREGL